MRAMILAAGRGARMGALTEKTPKPLLRVRNQYLIEYAIASIKRAGITEIVINVSHLAEKIQAALGDGERYGVRIFYSLETERLETGGGILNALPLLGDAPFVVMSSDIITDYPIKNLVMNNIKNNLAHLIMVNNPSYHAQGDYGLSGNQIIKSASNTFTYASVGLFCADFFAGCAPGFFRLTQILNPMIDAARVTGELYDGVWHNVGSAIDLDLIETQS